MKQIKITMNSINYFCCTKKMQLQYEQYGNIVIVDTTYRINMYNVPLGIISGINNEGRNLIFSMAFVNN